MTGVSFVIPVHNAGRGLIDTVRSVLAQTESDRPLEIIVVDDNSTDDAVGMVRRAFPEAPLVLVATAGVGAAAALNRGLAVARFPVIAQVDQDVVLAPSWLRSLLGRLVDDDVAAVQGQYVTDPTASLFARVMGRDLQERYISLDSETGHACTGNVIYRAEALRQVGGFDEAMGYGYDNDMSYRLRRQGLRLLYCAAAHSTHRWREGLIGYARQQYGFGYGRLDLVARHRGRLRGDSVSPLMMMLHPIVTGVAVLALVLAALLSDVWSVRIAGAGLALLAMLAVERAIVGVRASLRFRDWTPLLFPVAHLVRDVAWVGAIVVWTTRRLAGVDTHPGHSMKPRTVGDAAEAWVPGAAAPGVIPGDRSGHVESRARRVRPPSGAA